MHRKWEGLLELQPRAQSYVQLSGDLQACGAVQVASLASMRSVTQSIVGDSKHDKVCETLQRASQAKL